MRLFVTGFGKSLADLMAARPNLIVARPQRAPPWCGPSSYNPAASKARARIEERVRAGSLAKMWRGAKPGPDVGGDQAPDRRESVARRDARRREATRPAWAEEAARHDATALRRRAPCAGRTSAPQRSARRRCETPEKAHARLLDLWPGWPPRRPRRRAAQPDVMMSSLFGERCSALALLLRTRSLPWSFLNEKSDAGEGSGLFRTCGHFLEIRKETNWS